MNTQAANTHKARAQLPLLSMVYDMYFDGYVLATTRDASSTGFASARAQDLIACREHSHTHEKRLSHMFPEMDFASLPQALLVKTSTTECCTRRHRKLMPL